MERWRSTGPNPCHGQCVPYPPTGALGRGWLIGPEDGDWLLPLRQSSLGSFKDYQKLELYWQWFPNLGCILGTPRKGFRLLEDTPDHLNQNFQDPQAVIKIVDISLVIPTCNGVYMSQLYPLDVKACEWKPSGQAYEEIWSFKKHLGFTWLNQWIPWGRETGC